MTGGPIAVALPTAACLHVLKRHRLFVIVGPCAVAMLAAVLGGLYWACQQSPPFYNQALAQDPATAHSASDALVRQAAELASDVRRPGRWQAQFTAEQINGWLAYDEVH